MKEVDLFRSNFQIPKKPVHVSRFSACQISQIYLNVQEFVLHRSHKDHSILFRLHHGKQILMLVYVNDIVITGDDAQGISELKQ